MDDFDQEKIMQGPNPFHASSDALVKLDPSKSFFTKSIPRKTDIQFRESEEVREEVVSLRQFTASDANSSSIVLKSKLPLTQRS